MKNILKKLFRSIFLILMIFIATHHLEIAKEIRNEIKKEVHLHILKNNISGYRTVFFNEDNLSSAVWKEENEFELSGILYDIISVKSINGKKIYKCIEDIRETKVANYITYFKNSTNHFFQKNSHHLAKKINFKIISKKNEFYFTNFEKVLNIFFYKNLYAYNRITSVTDPPQNVFIG